MTFFFALVQELGKEHTHSQNMGRAACIVGSEKVKALIEEDKFQEAYDVALCAFQFIRSHRYYHDSQNFGYGWKLSLYLAGRNVRIKHDNKVHSQMLELSRDIIREVLSACKEANISMVQVKLEDLENLIDLLGAQKNYVDLEGLLAQLWNSRSVQKTWSRSLIINLGGLYVQAMYCNSHHAEAIRLCENICHNLRRAIGFGPLHPTTLRLSRLLSALYTGDSRHRDAMAVHEEILRSELDNEYEKGDEGVLSESVETVRENLEWLKRTYQRLGEWDKSEAMYRSLYTDLDRRYGAKLNVQPVDKWIPKGADSVGTYAPPALWSLNERVPQVAIEGQQRKGPPEQQPKGEQLHTQNGGIKPRKRSLLERARASWGFSNSREHLHPTSVAA